MSAQNPFKPETLFYQEIARFQWGKFFSCVIAAFIAGMASPIMATGKVNMPAMLAAGLIAAGAAAGSFIVPPKK